MPIYTYTCPECKYVFDKIVHSKDDQVICPECKAVSEYTFNPKGLQTIITEGKCGNAKNGYTSKL